ncbi:MAG: hypothetical protein Q4C56_01665 [Peptococcaceae bacterium]|nr:hypothetical protein [Peptococcaceae bacterium]
MARLSDPIKSVKGIGPKKQQLFAGLGIHTLRDALFFYPFRYDDWSTLLPVAALMDKETAVFVGSVSQVEVTNTSRRNFKVVKALLSGEQGDVVAVWFNRYQIEKYLRPNTRVLVYGRVRNDYHVEIQVQSHQFIRNQRELDRLLTLHPVYSLTDGLTKVDLLHVTDAAQSSLSRSRQSTARAWVFSPIRRRFATCTGPRQWPRPRQPSMISWSTNFSP